MGFWSKVGDGKNYRLVSSPKLVSWLFNALKSVELCSFDIETSHRTAAKSMAGQHDVVVGGISFSWQKDQAAYLPLYTGRGTETWWKRDDVFNALLNRLEEFLSGPCEKVGQNVKFDAAWMHRCFGIVTKNIVFDTMLAHHLLDEEGRITCRHGLKPMAKFYLDPQADRYEHELKSALEHYDPVHKRYTEVDLDILYPYACSDADYTLQLMHIFEPQLEAQGLLDLFYAVVMPLQHVCMLAEIGGMPIDMEKNAELSALYAAKREELRPRIYELSGFQFDISSPQQTAEVLYSKLGLPVQYGKKGNISTDKDALERLKELHPVVPFLHEFRSVEKLDSGYVESVRKRIDPIDGKLHPTFLIHGTVTGRLSTEDPNVQNWPRPEHGGVLIKAMFISGPGQWIVGSDFGQIELRMAAHCSREPAWVDAFRAGADVHSQTAIKCYHLDCAVEDVKKLHEEKRSFAKCFHPDTEVLTRSGWKRIVDLKQGEEVLQAEPQTGGQVNLSWVVPLEVFTKKHPSGKLVHLRNEGIDLRVTPDHRMLAWNSISSKHKVVMPEDFGKVRLWANAGALFSGEESQVTEAWWRLAVALQADGSDGACGAVRWGFTKQRKIDRLRHLLSKADATFTTGVSKNGQNPDVTWFRLSSSEGGDKLWRLLDNKRLPWQWLNLSFAVRNVIVDELQHWDACKKSNWRMFRYSSAIEQNVDVAQALAASVGRKTRKIQQDDGTWNLTIRDKATTRGENVQTEVLPYDGEVACLSVPSTFVLVRDGGVPVVTGQTVNFGILYGMSAYGLAPRLKMEVEEAEAFIAQYFEGLQRLKRWIEETHELARVQGYVTNPFGRRRRIPDIQLFVPKRLQKPYNAPGCYGRKQEAPSVIRTYYPEFDFERDMAVFSDVGRMQVLARDLAGKNPRFNKCAGCPFISMCVYDAERGFRQSLVNEAKRQAVNSIIQSAASDMAAKSFSKVLLVCRENGIPISVSDDVHGIQPWNIVHDELLFLVHDEYVEPARRIIKDVMINIYPECLVPLDVDMLTVRRLSDKHEKH